MNLCWLIGDCKVHSVAVGYQCGCCQTLYNGITCIFIMGTILKRVTVDTTYCSTAPSNSTRCQSSNGCSVCTQGALHICSTRTNCKHTSRLQQRETKLIIVNIYTMQSGLYLLRKIPSPVEIVYSAVSLPYSLSHTLCDYWTRWQTKKPKS